MFEPSKQSDIEFAELVVLDQICEDFESAWKTNCRPIILDYLQRITDASKAAALCELLPIEWEYIRKSHIAFKIDDYLELFPEYASIIMDAWQPFQDRNGTGESVSNSSLRFTVLHEHAKGGLGSIHIAHDKELGRKVAFKSIHQEYENDPLIRDRFLREAFITSQLEHPGIAPIYGLGRTENGIPYYAMRLIQGASFQTSIERVHSEFQCDSNRESVADVSSRFSKGLFRSRVFRELLSKFAFACRVVDFAHGKGIVHRDIKPSNIMLGDHGETMVVDWGLAKQMGNEEQQAEATVRSSAMNNIWDTSPGEVMGTPAFMSPEQASGEIEKVGPQSDVYSLGATLYCLITGLTPGRTEVDSKEMAKNPNTGQAQSVPPIELQAICGKAMSFDISGRYKKAAEIAIEVESWLAGEPVSAYPEPMIKRFRRWVTQHSVLASSLITASVATSVLLAAATWILAAKNRELTTTKQALVVKEREVAGEIAQTLNIRSKLESSFFAIGELFAKLDPEDNVTPPLQTLRLGLKDLAKSLFLPASSKESWTFPIRLTIGKSLSGLGYYSDAIDLLESLISSIEDTLGPNHNDTIQAKHELARSYKSAGNANKAVELLQGICDLILAHPEAWPSEIRAKMIVDLANVYASNLQFKEADELINGHKTFLEEALLASKNDSYLLDVRKIQADIVAGTGNPSLAVKMYEDEVLVPLDEILQDKSLNAGQINDWTKYAEFLYSAGEHDRAQDVLGKCLKRIQTHYGESHPASLTTLSSLATILSESNQFSKALEIRRQCFAISRSLQGPQAVHTIGYARQLAAELRRIGNVQEAFTILSDSIEQFEAQFGTRHLITAQGKQELAFVYLDLGQADEAIKVLKDSLDITEGSFARDHQKVLEVRRNLAIAYHLAGDTEKAAEEFLEVLRVQEVALGANHPETVYAKRNLAAIFLNAKRYEEALAYHQALAEYHAKEGSDSLLALAASSRVALNQLYLGRVQEAADLFEDIDRTFTEKHGPTNATAIRARIEMATVYLNVGHYEKANQLNEETIQRILNDNQAGGLSFAIRAFRTLFDGWQETIAPDEILVKLSDLHQSSRAKTENENELSLTVLQALGTQQLKLEQFESARDTFKNCYEATLSTDSATNRNLECGVFYLATLGKLNSKDQEEEFAKVLGKKLDMAFPEKNFPSPIVNAIGFLNEDAATRLRSAE